MRLRRPAEGRLDGDPKVSDKVPAVASIEGHEVPVHHRTPQHVGSLIMPEHHIAAVPPIVSGDYIVAGCQNGDVVAWKADFMDATLPILHSVDTLTGREPDMVWQCNVASPVACLAELSKDIVVATEVGFVFRILFPALKLKHSFQTHRCGISAMHVADDKIVIGFKTGFLEAFALNGTKIWEGIYENAEIAGLARFKDHLVITLKYQDAQRPATATMLEIIDTANLKGEVDLGQCASLPLPGREIIDVSYVSTRPLYVPSLGTNQVLVHHNTIVTSLADGSYVELAKVELGWQTMRQLYLTFPSIGLGQVDLVRNGEAVPHAVCCSRATSTLLIPISKNLPILSFAMPHDLDDDSSFRYTQATTSFVVKSVPVVAYVFSCGVIELFSCELQHSPDTLVLCELYKNGAFELLQQLLLSDNVDSEEAARDAARDAARTELERFGAVVSCDDLCYSADLEAVRSYLLQLKTDK